jgi:hypothetical protein
MPNLQQGLEYFSKYLGSNELGTKSSRLSQGKRKIFEPYFSVTHVKNVILADGNLPQTVYLIGANENLDKV